MDTLHDGSNSMPVSEQVLKLAQRHHMGLFSNLAVVVLKLFGGGLVNPTVCVMPQVTAVVEPERERLDAILVFPSMPAVMRLNKLGTFNLSQLGLNKKSSPIGEFMKSMRKSNDRFEESMLKLVRTLPAVLKYLPTDKAQDAKNFIQVSPGVCCDEWTGTFLDPPHSLLLAACPDITPPDID